MIRLNTEVQKLSKGVEVLNKVNQKDLKITGELKDILELENRDEHELITRKCCSKQQITKALKNISKKSVCVDEISIKFDKREEKPKEIKSNSLNFKNLEGEKLDQQSQIDEFLERYNEQRSKELNIDEIKKIVDKLGDYGHTGKMLLNYITTIKNKSVIGIGVNSLDIIKSVLDIVKYSESINKMNEIRKEFMKDPEMCKFTKEAIITKGHLWWKRQIKEMVVDEKQLKLYKRQLKKELKEAGNNKDLVEKLAQKLDKIYYYRLATILKNLNNDRLTKAAISVGINKVRVAGDVALLSGVGHKIAIGVKLTADAAEFSIKVYKDVVDYGRESANSLDAWEYIKKLFDYKKSKRYLSKKYKKYTDFMLKVFNSLPVVSEVNQLTDEHKKIHSAVLATGGSVEGLYRARGDLEEQRKILLSALGA